MAGGTLGLAVALAACGPDPGPSWNMSSRPAVEGDSLTIQRVTGGDPEFTTLRSEDPARLRETASALLSSRPTSPEAAMRGIPDYAPVARPAVDAATGTPPPRVGSSTPPSIVAPIPEPERARVSAPLPPVRPATPPVRETTRPVTIPGEPTGTVSGTGRIQTYTQPGNPAGSVAIQDGGTTTIIQPGGRVTTVPTPR
ncbi:hypothetical protein [Roseomonas fluvialis]|uniref:Uncharacterized protein n=1 Tax=Roseomonas fluvialis TaxID=1750527 RepID=A0ABM7Y870_9PROT|nr:hypothetical protein [Roseomonas fluvialis]BDG74228.1 hypothetical protein Rmf_41570 [Roseomonas fluvialis]